MADTLAGAVIAHAPTNITGMTGGFWDAEAPEESVLPHAVVTHEVESQESFSATGYYERGALVFEVYDREKAPAVALAKQIGDVYQKRAEWPTIPLAAPQRLLALLRRRQSFEPQEKRSPDGSVVYLATVEFDTQVQGTRQE